LISADGLSRAAFSRGQAEKRKPARAGFRTIAHTIAHPRCGGCYSRKAELCLSRGHRRGTTAGGDPVSPCARLSLALAGGVLMQAALPGAGLVSPRPEADPKDLYYPGRGEGMAGREPSPLRRPRCGRPAKPDCGRPQRSGWQRPRRASCALAPATPTSLPRFVPTGKR
jgi:hypothetical protein